MLSEIEVMRILLDIDEATCKNLAIRCQIKKLLDKIENNCTNCRRLPGNPEQKPPEPKQKRGKQQAAAVITQDSVKAGKLTQPEDEPQKLLRPKEVIGKTNRGGAKSTFDTGKLMALCSAGWSIKAIADEMGCTEQTVRNHMKKEGIK